MNYANPTELDIDSTVQEANIAYPAIPNLLVKVAVLASKVAKKLNQLCHKGAKHYHVGLTNLTVIPHVNNAYLCSQYKLILLNSMFFQKILDTDLWF